MHRSFESVEPRRLFANTLFPLANGMDLVYDAQRHNLYVSQSTGAVARVSLDSMTALSSIVLGGSQPLGADISPDSQYLLVADGGANRVRRINLVSQAVTDAFYTNDFGEGNAYDVAMMNNGSALVTTQYNGSGWTPLRRLNYVTNTMVGTNQKINQNTLMDRSADGSKVFLQESNISSGPLDMFSAATNSYSASIDSGMFVGYTPAAVNANGTRVAVNLSGIAMLDGSLAGVGTVDYTSGGIAFDSAHPLVFTIDTDANQIVAYNAVTLGEQYRVPVGENVESAQAMGPGTMKVSPDGKRLFLLTLSGLRVIDLPQSDGVQATLSVTPSATFTKAGTPLSLTVTAYDQAGVVATGFTGQVSFTSTNSGATLPAAYTFTAADKGVHTFPFSLSTTGRFTVSVTVTGTGKTTVSPPITIHAPGAAIPLTDSVDNVYDPVLNRIYSTTYSGDIQRYDVATETLLSPLHVAASLRGVDVGPDGSIYVVDGTRSAANGFIYKINPTTGAKTTYTVDLGETSYPYGAPYSIAVLNNNVAVVTGTWEGSGHSPMYKVDLTTGAVSTLMDSLYEAKLSRSADRKTVFITEPGISSGPTHLLSSDNLSSFLISRDFDTYLSGVGTPLSPDGTKISVGGLVLNRSLQTIANLGVVTGIAFSPDGKWLYASDGDRLIKVFSTTTWLVAKTFDLPASIALSSAHVPLKADGSILFVPTVDGIIPLTVSNSPGVVLTAPTHVNEAGKVSLIGTASDVNAVIQWDLSYDGSTFSVDAQGATAGFTAGDGASSRLVAARTLLSGVYGPISTALIVIDNVAPTGVFVAGPAVGTASTVAFSNVTDPAAADVAAGLLYSFDFNNDGDFTDPGDGAGSTAASASFTFATAGTYTVRGRVSDKDGGFTDYSTQVVVNTVTPPPNVTTEAETGVFSGGTAKGSANGGFTGTGYADYAGLNSAAQWTVSRTAAGSATISFRYANGGTTNRPLTVYVNGASVGTLPFAPTGGWSTWASVSLTANLIAGNNVISAVASTSNGGANVDSLTISGGTTPPPPPATGLVNGFLFDDTSKDGVYQANEPKSVGKTVFIDLDADGLLDANERRVTTDVNGEWSFNALPAGNYAIRPVLASGTVLSSVPINLALEAGQAIGGLSIGTKTTAVPPPPPPTGTASIAGTVFNDNNNNAKYDAGDGIGKAVVVFLDTDNDGVLDSGEKSVTTDTNGKFTFTGLAAGTYRVRRVFATGQTYSTPLANITLTAGQVKTGVLIGTKKV